MRRQRLLWPASRRPPRESPRARGRCLGTDGQIGAPAEGACATGEDSEEAGTHPNTAAAPNCEDRSRILSRSLATYTAVRTTAPAAVASVAAAIAGARSVGCHAELRARGAFTMNFKLQMRYISAPTRFT
eukprot:scaffold31414_cov90-Isochrysis_galbana.AAC.1